MTGLRPEKELDALLEGRITPEEAHWSVRSWSRLHIYRAACWVLSGGTRDERAARLAKAPAHARAWVEQEALRIWEQRKKKLFDKH